MKLSFHAIKGPLAAAIVTAWLMVVALALPARADDNWDAVRPLWERVGRHLGDAQSEQARVVRALSLEDEARRRPDVAPENVRDWLAENQPISGSRRDWLAAIQARLRLSQLWLDEPAARNAGILAAYEAAQLAHNGPNRDGDGDGDGDEPLRAAIGAAFLLPYLPEVPEHAENFAFPARWELVKTLESRFVGFRVRGEGEDERVEEIAPREPTLDYLRLFIALATPAQLDWPRAHLARALLHGDGVSQADEAEAFAALRAIQPGPGALFFRSAMPRLVKEMDATLTPTEARDAARSKNFYGDRQSWQTPQLEAWQALMNVAPDQAERRQQLLEDLRARAEMSPAQAQEQERATIAALQKGELDQAIEPLSEAKTQADYFRFARMVAVASEFVLSQKTPDSELAKNAFKGWKEFDVRSWNVLRSAGFARWNAGDFNYFPVADRVRNNLALLFVVPLLPQIETSDGDNAEPIFYNTLRALSTQLAKVYPMSISRREGALKWSDAQKADPQTRVDAYPAEPPLAMQGALAANDLFTRWAINDNHAEFIRYDLLQILESLDRYDDAWITLEELRNWKRYPKQSLAGFYFKGLTEALRARTERPSVMIRGNAR